MAALQEYKCPCCGGAIAFDSTWKRWPPMTMN